MSQAKILNFFTNLIIFKPVIVMIAGLLGIQHVMFVSGSIVILFFLILLIGKLNKAILVLLTLSLMIVMWLFTAAFNQNEYIYNALFIINFGLIIMLFLLNRDFLYSRKNSFWRVSLILTLGASYFDAVFFNNFTTFKETYTLIGYDNPLWAARDLGIIVFYFLLTSKKNQTLEVITILATMLFFLEARAAFLITLFLYFIRFTPLYLITGLSFLTVIYSFIIDINPFTL